MKIAGIIAEYNPFHKGHAYHIRITREITGCDYVVVCMAGSYVQRGQAAMLSKWVRTEMALRCGADAVFELPALFAVRTADAFARGGVGVLGALGVDILSFGSETDDLTLLERLSHLRDCEPEEVSSAVRLGLADGKSHARAQGEAWAAHLGMDAAVLNAPNMILGSEYLRAIRRLHPDMQAVTVRRIGGYHDENASGGFASATAIRKALADGKRDAAASAVPDEIAGLLGSAGEMHAPDDLVLYCLREMREEEIARLPDVAEGLEKRVLRCARSASSLEDLIEMLKCKRYTRARLMRLTAHAMLGLTADLAGQHPLPEYARLTGMRSDARPLLKALKARASLPIVSDAAQLSDSAVFQLECRATDLRALQCSRPEERLAGQEFTRKFVRI